MRSGFLLLTILFTLAQCASPRLVKWGQNEMLICCDGCQENKWENVVTHHCRGTATALKAEKMDKVAGFQTAPRNPSDEESRHGNEECRWFHCSGMISTSVY